MTVPKLRFKEFGSEYNEYNLGKLLKSYRLGGNYSNSEIKTNLPLIKMGNLNRGSINLSKIEYIPSDEIIDDQDQIQLGDLFFNTRNTLDLVGKVAIWRNELPVAYYNSNLMRLEFENNFYMNFLLNTEKSLEKLKAIASGTTSVAAIYTKDLLKVKVKIPFVDEQTKIASFLSNVDEKISQLTQKHQLLSQYKQGMMQKLFSQQVRFKADDGSEFGEWEYYKLGELTTLITKGTTPTSLGGKFENSGINFIKIESLSSDGKFLLDKFAYIDEVTHNKLARSQLENEDILFSIAGALGRVAIISNDYLPANTNQALAIIRLRNKNITQYIYYFLNSDYVKKIIETESVQLAQANFSLGQLSDLDIVLPCHEEQTKIANFLSAIDQKIVVVAQQIEQAKQWKKGLLQQMFV
jgi:type I restriction enzyme S subunit